MSKEKGLEDLMGDLRKIFGDGSVGTAKELIKNMGHYSTGSLQLDARLGGGVPKGRIIELKGPYSSGKTTLAIHAIADCQKKGDTALFVDLEGTFDRTYATNLGVDVGKLIYIPPMAGEEAMEIAEKLVRTGEIGLMVIDSIAALLPGKIAEDAYGKANMAFHAKLVGEVVKRFTAILYQNKTCFLALNQIRLKPGVSFGNPEYSTGGESLPFYSSVILDIRKSGKVHTNTAGDIIGEPRKIKVVKSKINASVNSTMMVDIKYGEGFDQTGEIVDACEELELLTKSGAWYAYDGEKIGNGREKTKQFLRDNPELLEELRDKVLDALFLVRSDEED